MAFDTKYGKVTTEFGTIGEDEPVIVFRARDANVLDMLANYWGLCKAAGSPQHHLDLIDKTMKTIEAWQEENHDQVKVPDSNAYMKRMADSA